MLLNCLLETAIGRTCIYRTQYQVLDLNLNAYFYSFHRVNSGVGYFAKCARILFIKLMKTINSRVAILFIVVLIAWVVAVSAQVKPQVSVVPVNLEVPFAPIPVKAMDKMNLVYELHLTNFSRG